MAILESVNIGGTVDVPWGPLKRSAIDKRPVAGPVRVHTLGVGDDQIADLVNHGGADHAVYAYAREDLDGWAQALGRELAPGQFGENLTTSGVDVTDAKIGDRWRIGSALLEVCGVRIPCSVFEGFLGEAQWVKRFTRAGSPGAYLRVIEEGELRAGDAIEIDRCGNDSLTIGFVFRALTTRRDLAAELSTEPRLSIRARRRVEALLKAAVK